MIIYTVIVTYNGERWIKTCLNSLKICSFDVKTIVVDNASTDGTTELITTHFPEVIVLKQDQNLGFGRANNIGISYALRHQADFVFLLNQDAFVKPETIENLVNCSLEHRDFGILSPIHLNWDGQELEHYFSRFVLVNKGFYSDYVLKKDVRPIYDVPYVNAAGWLIPKCTLEIVGGFDPIFFHYGEDNNYCQRVIYHGFKIGIVPECFLCHDSVMRNEAPDFLFSKTYFRDELNKLQIQFGNINKSVTQGDYRRVKWYVFKLILLNLLQFNFKHALGYIKKYSYFNKGIIAIKQSRKIAILKQAHYLEL